MYARATELAEVVDVLTDRRHVIVEGLSGSGRSELLRRAATDLEARGVAVLNVSAITPSLRGPSSAASLIDEIGSPGSAVIVIDDVDEASASLLGLVEELEHALRPTILSASRPVSRAAEESRPRFARRAVRVSLRPYDFVRTVEHLRRTLGVRLGPELAARLFIKSGGVPGIAEDLFRSARECELVAEADDVWDMVAPSLWNPRLVPIVTDLLRGVSREGYEGLVELALTGPLPIDEVTGGAEVLAELSHRGLVTHLGETRHPLVTVFPPLIADWVRNQAADATAVIHRVHALPHAREDAASRWSEAELADAALARFMREKLPRDLDAAWERWTRNSDRRNAVEVLRRALETGTPGLPLDVVLETMPNEDDAASDIAEYVALASLAASSGLVDPEAFDVARAIIEAHHPSVRAAVENELTMIRVVFAGATAATPDEPIEREDGPRPIADVTRSFLLAIRGDGDAALTALPAAPLGAGIGGIAHHVARGLALFARSDIETMTFEAAENLVRARAVFDRPSLFVHSYFATLGYLRTGRWGEAQSILGEVLTLGTPPRYLAQIYAGMARLSAMLAVRAGDPVFARTLLDAVDDLAADDGPVPGAQRSISDAVRALIDGDWKRAARAMEAAADESQLQGSVLAEVSARLYAVCLSPTPQVYAGLDALLRGAPSSPHRGFAAFVERVMNDPLRAAEIVRDLFPGEDEFLAVLALRSLEEQAGDGTATQEALAKALREAIRLTGMRPAKEYFPDRTSTKVRLTDREREIGLLVGTRTNAQIASLLHVSTSTVANHISNALHKIGAVSRHELLEHIRNEAAERP